MRVQRIVGEVFRAIRRGRSAGDAIRHVAQRFGLRHTRARAFITAGLRFEMRSRHDPKAPVRRRSFVLEQSVRRLDLGGCAGDQVHATVDAWCDLSGTVAAYTSLPAVRDRHWISRGEWPIIGADGLVQRVDRPQPADRCAS